MHASFTTLLVFLTSAAFAELPKSIERAHWLGETLTNIRDSADKPKNQRFPSPSSFSRPIFTEVHFNGTRLQHTKHEMYEMGKYRAFERRHVFWRGSKVTKIEVVRFGVKFVYQKVGLAKWNIRIEKSSTGSFRKLERKSFQALFLRSPSLDDIESNSFTGEIIPLKDGTLLFLNKTRHVAGVWFSDGSRVEKNALGDTLIWDRFGRLLEIRNSRRFLFAYDGSVTKGSVQSRKTFQPSLEKTDQFTKFMRRTDTSLWGLRPVAFEVDNREGQVERLWQMDPKEMAKIAKPLLFPLWVGLEGNQWNGLVYLDNSSNNKYIDRPGFFAESPRVDLVMNSNKGDRGRVSLGLVDEYFQTQGKVRIIRVRKNPLYPKSKAKVFVVNQSNKKINPFSVNLPFLKQVKFENRREVLQVFREGRAAILWEFDLDDKGNVKRAVLPEGAVLTRKGNPAKEKLARWDIHYQTTRMFDRPEEMKAYFKHKVSQAILGGTSVFTPKLKHLWEKSEIIAPPQFAFNGMISVTTEGMNIQIPSEKQGKSYFFYDFGTLFKRIYSDRQPRTKFLFALRKKLGLETLSICRVEQLLLQGSNLAAKAYLKWASHLHRLVHHAGELPVQGFVRGYIKQKSEFNALLRKLGDFSAKAITIRRKIKEVHKYYGVHYKEILSLLESLENATKSLHKEVLNYVDAAPGFVYYGLNFVMGFYQAGANVVLHAIDNPWEAMGLMIVSVFVPRIVVLLMAGIASVAAVSTCHSIARAINLNKEGNFTKAASAAAQAGRSSFQFGFCAAGAYVGYRRIQCSGQGEFTLPRLFRRSAKPKLKIYEPSTPTPNSPPPSSSSPSTPPVVRGSSAPKVLPKASSTPELKLWQSPTPSSSPIPRSGVGQGGYLLSGLSKHASTALANIPILVSSPTSPIWAKQGSMMDPSDLPKRRSVPSKPPPPPKKDGEWETWFDGNRWISESQEGSGLYVLVWDGNRWIWVRLIGETGTSDPEITIAKHFWNRKTLKYENQPIKIRNLIKPTRVEAYGADKFNSPQVLAFLGKIRADEEEEPNPTNRVAVRQEGMLILADMLEDNDDLLRAEIVRLGVEKQQLKHNEVDEGKQARETNRRVYRLLQEKDKVRYRKNRRTIKRIIKDTGYGKPVRVLVDKINQLKRKQINEPEEEEKLFAEIRELESKLNQLLNTPNDAQTIRKLEARIKNLTNKWATAHFGKEFVKSFLGDALNSNSFDGVAVYLAFDLLPAGFHFRSIDGANDYLNLPKNKRHPVMDDLANAYLDQMIPIDGTRWQKFNRFIRNMWNGK